MLDHRQDAVGFENSSSIGNRNRSNSCFFKRLIKLFINTIFVISLMFSNTYEVFAQTNMDSLSEAFFNAFYANILSSSSLLLKNEKIASIIFKIIIPIINNKLNSYAHLIAV